MPGQEGRQEDERQAHYKIEGRRCSLRHPVNCLLNGIAKEVDAVRQVALRRTRNVEITAANEDGDVG